jgi:hypothetical protein
MPTFLVALHRCRSSTQLQSAAKPIDGSNGFRLDGQPTANIQQPSVASGDINKDTYADIIIGGLSSGVYYVPGKSGAWSATQTLQ